MEALQIPRLSGPQPLTQAAPVILTPGRDARDLVGIRKNIPPAAPSPSLTNSWLQQHLTKHPNRPESQVDLAQTVFLVGETRSSYVAAF